MLPIIALILVTVLSKSIYSDSVPIVCSDNEIFSNCTEPCAPTCTNPRVPYCSIYSCRPGCNCKDGFIRTTEEGKCVEKTSCLSKDDLNFNRTPQCPIGETPTQCENPCLPTCDRPELILCKLAWCSYGCLCPENYVRISKGGKCVPQKECNATKT